MYSMFLMQTNSLSGSPSPPAHLRKPCSMAYFQTPISYQVKRLNPREFEAACRHHSEQAEVKRIFRHKKFEAERSVERKSILESRIRTLKRRNHQLVNELREQRAAVAGGAGSEHPEIIAHLHSKDLELRKLREEKERLAEEKMEWEKVLGAVERLKLVSAKEAGMERTWEEVAALLKRAAVCGGGDEAMKVFGADSMMMMTEPFLDSLKAIEGCFEKMESQKEGMRQAVELLCGKLEEDGFVDVAVLLEVENALENGFDGESS